MSIKKIYIIYASSVIDILTIYQWSHNDQQLNIVIYIDL